MKNDGMLFCEEDSVAGYLGIHIDCCKNKTIHLTQRGLAQCIVEALHLSNTSANPVNTPCTKYLPINEDIPSAHG